MSGGLFIGKFGGAAFRSPAAHKDLARYVANRIAADELAHVVLVVSAMSGGTAGLDALLHEVAEHPDDDVVAGTLAVGELLNSNLVTAALRDVGIAASAVEPVHTGFFATGTRNHAALRKVEPGPLRSALNHDAVVVLPGGEAMGEDGSPLIMGRNSSDLSAIAAAIALGVTSCEIFSDSRGVCSADPRIVPDAVTLPHVSYATMRQMSESGADVLHWSAVSWAERCGIEIVCASLPPDPEVATVISDRRTPISAALLNETAKIWKLARSDARPIADRLESDGVDTLVTDIDGEPYLVVVTGADLQVDDPTDGRGERVRDCSLISVLLPDGSVTRRLVPSEHAHEAVQAEHRALFPG